MLLLRGNTFLGPISSSGNSSMGTWGYYALRDVGVVGSALVTGYVVIFLREERLGLRHLT